MAIDLIKISALVFLAFTTPIKAETIRGKAHVRDGDTIVVSGQPVRLQGVDAPESDTRRGRSATAAMAGFVRGRQVTCDLTRKRSYDRRVGTCSIMVDGRPYDLGASIIAAGHALDCARYSGGAYQQFETAEARQGIRRASYCR